LTPNRSNYAAVIDETQSEKGVTTHRNVGGQPYPANLQS